MRDFYKLIPYLKPYTKNIILNFIFNILAAIFSVFSFAMIMPFLSVIFKTQELITEFKPFEFTGESIKHSAFYYLSKIILEHGEVAALLVISAFLSGTIMIKAAFDYLARYSNVELQNGVPRDIYNKMFKKVVDLPVSYFSDEKKGDIMARMSSDITIVRDSMVGSFESMLKNPITLLIFIIALIYLSPHLTIFILFLLPVSGYILGRLARKLKRGSAQAQAKQGEILSIIEESIAGMRVIKAFNATLFMNNKFRYHNELLKNKQDEVLKRNYLASPVSESLGMTVFAVTMCFGGTLVLNKSSYGLNPEQFIYYLALFSQVISPAKAFTNSFYNLKKGAASLDRIDELLDANVSIQDKPNAKPISSFEHSIEFKNVSFAYSNDKQVLQNINLKLEKGKSIALVGQSGSGKTTISNLLPRFYDISSGDILVDNISIKDYKINDLRNLMGIVTQDSILFNDTFYNNIAFGIENATEDLVIEAAKIANAYDFIMETSNGFQTNIGDGGGKLSGGQRQRISIARAVLKNPPILILDEATSALDTQSERLVQDALINLMKNRTSLVIAHRLSTIKHVDEIYVMSDGKVIEKGNHEKLIDVNGAYKKLHDLQLI